MLLLPTRWYIGDGLSLYSLLVLWHTSLTARHLHLSILNISIWIHRQFLHLIIVARSHEIISIRNLSLLLHQLSTTIHITLGPLVLLLLTLAQLLPMATRLSVRCLLMLLRECLLVWLLTLDRLAPPCCVVVPSRIGTDLTIHHHTIA